ncbi:MAG: 2-succinyl-5-enolpyruvyl-6-hydroxy-3-cyclohexene-1-carboxylic-acid synthase [Deltaproteobacteria bacterium]|nr:2-succinyl-5-enolpyruvyl-6-hydroxy-3-cyclohexene-1-carboxylic-acid synthase [Deltaproteobacteria bacterium]
MSAPNRNIAFALALFDELARAGVREVCVCPGSRSAPLAIAAARTPALRVRTHLDERSAGFFALGLAKASGAPVAVLCSSGTAAANFLPALVEANLAQAPLIALTADRPPELRDWGAAQTIDQQRLFGSHVRWFAELPLPEPNAALLRQLRATAARAVAVAGGPPAGPVHLNVPLREPLDPRTDPADREALAALADEPGLHGRDRGPYLRVSPAERAPDPALVRRWAAELAASRRGVLIVGASECSAALGVELARLSRALGWPILADAASGLRGGAHVARAPLLGAYDSILRAERFAAEHAPELVLRFGAAPTSKGTATWIERSPGTELRIVDSEQAFRDPAHHAAEIARAEPARLCAELADALEPRTGAGPGSWLADFVAAEARAQRALAAGIAAEPELFAPGAARVLGASWPAGGTIFASNSMSIRDLDGFLAPRAAPLRVLASRGANGIDGITSAALGAAAASDAPLACLIGDLAFLHDAGGLLAARRLGLSTTFLVVNDDGGGIFSYLPVAAYGEDADFERLFALPHGVDLAELTAFGGGRHARVSKRDELEAELDRARSEGGLQVLELRVDRGANVAHHRALWAAAANAVDGDSPR